MKIIRLNVLIIDDVINILYFNKNILLAKIKKIF